MNPTTLIRYANLKRLRENAASLKDFAERAGLSIAYASQLTKSEPGKNLGDELARKIEARLELEQGWLDKVHGEPNTSVAEATVRPAPAAGPSADCTSLEGLSPIQVALVTTAIKLCRSNALPDKACLALLTSWQEMIE